MDRPLDDKVRRDRARKRALTAAGAIAAGAAAWLGLTSLLSPTLALGRLRTGTVDVGPIAATVSAPGTVVPEAERVVSCPVDTRVLRVLRRPGAAVKAGESLVEVDTTGPSLAAQRLRKELRLKESQAERARLALAGSLSGLASQVRVKELSLSTARASLARSRKLFAEGLVSEEGLRQAELDEARTAEELSQLREAMVLARRSGEVEEAALEAELANARREAEEAERELLLASARSESDGVVTFAVSEEGAAVRRGDVLARVADLTAFRVDAEVPDVHAASVRPGQEALVRLDSVRLAATVSRVQPEVRDGRVTVSLALAEKAHPRLRPSLRVEVELVTDRRERAVRLPRGSFGAAEGGVDVWVLRKGEAVRTRVALGVSNADAYEALSGLSAGDVVVLSEMADFAHLSRVRVKGWEGGSR